MATDDRIAHCFANPVPDIFYQRKVQSKITLSLLLPHYPGHCYIYGIQKLALKALSSLQEEWEAFYKWKWSTFFN